MLRILITILLVVRTLSTLSQTRSLQWQKNIGGSGEETNLKIAQNTFGDIYITGTTTSNDIDITGNHGGSDIFVAKLNSTGDLQWTKTYGGTGNDTSINIAACTDGGVVVLCHSNSTDGNFSQTGAYLIKFSATGVENFKVPHGGEPGETGSLIQTSDGGYAFLSTLSVDSNGRNLWLVKTNSNGQLSWEKNYGGTLDETAASLKEYNSNFYLLGHSISTVVNGQNNHGGKDILFIKTNKGGLVQTTKMYGGNLDETASEIKVVQNVLGAEIQIYGTSYSTNPGSNTSSNGQSDFWIFSTDLDGDFNFGLNDLFGGDSLEFSSSFVFDQTQASPLMSGTTYSDSLKTNLNDPEVPNVCLLEIIPFGDAKNVQIFGGSGEDLASGMSGTIDGGILIGVISNSTDEDFAINKGGRDFWVIKLGGTCPDNLTIGGETFTESAIRTAEDFIKVTNTTFEGAGTNIKLRSNYILLEPNATTPGTAVEIKAGTVFETEIGGCP